ncbi:hypothetical protein FGF1_07590 [Flavobacteriaceae bacterium GF1]
MKVNVTVLILLCSMFLVSAQETDEINTEVLLGEWKLDMSPQNPNDNNFAMMRITSVDNNEMKGTFYREGVKLRNGRINTQSAIIYGALISGDNSGEYNSAFYFKNGKLYGSTHAVQRGFLAIWVAEKIN